MDGKNGPMFIRSRLLTLSGVGTMKKMMFTFAIITLASFSCWANTAYDDLAKLVKAGIDEDVIIAYIDGSNAGFSLSPDNIVQLKSLGASDKVITAAILHKKSAADSGDGGSEPAVSSTDTAPAPQQAATPPAVVYETVPPAGGWVFFDDYWYWRYPTGVIVDLRWRRPFYYRHNHWIVRGHRGGYHRGHRGWR